MKRLEIANNAILLGRGVDEIKENDRIVGYKLGVASEARVTAMTTYYYNHQQAFQTEGSLIVASGGYARLAADQVAPPLDQREGKKMADLLVRNGVPHQLVEYEVKSDCTTGNYEETMREGFFDGKEFTTANPFLVVASDPHGRYRGVPLARAGFGIEDHAGVGLLVAEYEPRIVRVREFVGGLAMAQAIQEVQPEAFSADDMAMVGDHFEHIIGHPMAMAHAGLAQVVGESYDFIRHPMLVAA